MTRCCSSSGVAVLGSRCSLAAELINCGSGVLSSRRNIDYSWISHFAGKWIELLQELLPSAP